MADHPAPKVVEKLRGRTMVAIDGGTQALKRTLDARLEIVPGRTTTVSVPSPFGAVILNAACAEREHFTGSDRARLQTLLKALPDDAREWRSLSAGWRTNGQAALRILTA